jgi:predicted DNA-binding protein YlxM (UPF0122 family)
MFIAVETSDLVHSTKMSEATYKQAIDLLKEQLADNQSKFEARFDIFRGDAFQVVYLAPKFALRAILLTRLKLFYSNKGEPIEITQALSYGEQAKVNDDFSEAMGEVFVNSGRLLESSKRRSISLSFPESNGSTLLIANYLNLHLASLTQKQAEVLYHYLHDNFPEQHLIAEKLNITRQNVAAHLKRGGAEVLKHTIEFFEKLCDQQNYKSKNT